MNKKLSIISLLLAFIATLPLTALAAPKGDADEEKEGVDVKEIIFHHLGDGYGWEVPFSHVYRIPLPVIVKAEDGQWFCFSSNRLTEVEIIKDEATGKEKKESIPVIYSEERNGKTYQFIIAHVSEHKNKVVEIFSLTPEQEAEVNAEAAEIAAKGESHEHGVIVPGYVYHDGKYYREYRTFDISITKNVFALIITTVLVTWMMMAVVSYYKKKGMKAPRKGMGFMEMLIGFVYNDVIKANLGAVKGRKFAPYLLTCFFFILTMNILGLVVIFPGGANLTGNIAITLVLAVLTFLVVNIFGKKHYWKEIFWPDVPMLLKCPIPIMQLIEVFGIFTKPAALCIRLFANMMGGHMIVITLVCLIFIFAAFGAVAAGGATIISLLFTIFMLLLDVLVSFIQAYVFTLLSTLFIAASTEDPHIHQDAENIDIADDIEA